jgi:hypothetical protein
VYFVRLEFGFAKCPQKQLAFGRAFGMAFLAHALQTREVRVPSIGPSP